MSDIGSIGSPEAFRANLLNLKQQQPADATTSLVESKSGLPWQKSSQAVGYKAPQPEFERLLQEIMAPGNTPPSPARHATQDPTSVTRQPGQNGLHPEPILAQGSTNPFFFNYIAQPMNGHYRTELAKNAYNAMGRVV